MKSFMFFLFANFITTSFVYSQNRLLPQIDSKEEAISILKDNYFFLSLRNPTDTTININRFIEELDKIVSVDQEKKTQIQALLFSSIKQKKGEMINLAVVRQSTVCSNFIPCMGINVNNLVKENFSFSDYEKIITRLSNNIQRAISAYQYLVSLYKKTKANEGMIVIGYSDTKEFINIIFNYYDI